MNTKNQIQNNEETVLVTEQTQDRIDEKQKKQKDPEKHQKSINFADLFYFSTKKDKIFVIIAAIFSTTQGILLPGMSILFGDITNSFAPSDAPDAMEQLMNKVQSQCIQMIIVGGCVFFTSLVANILWQQTANNQVQKLKTIYFKKLITQNCSWYDQNELEKLSTEFVNNTDAFEQIFSSKLHIYFMSIGIILGGFIVGFAKGWLYTLIIIGLTPIMVFGMALFMYYTLKAVKIQNEAYSEAGAIADQTFTFIKTVKAFNGEDHEYDRYKKACYKAKRGTTNFEKKAALSFGLFFLSVLLMYGIAFFAGSRLISNKVFNHNTDTNYNVGIILTIFFAVSTSIFSFAQLGPVMKAVQGGKFAMQTVFKIMQNKTEEKSGQIKSEIKGEIKFKDVSFYYPSKPEKLVLDQVNLTIKVGQKVAFVGPSGCGKSTCIQLLQRYYDPTEGVITLDGIDIKEYDLKYLRNQLGLVSQQPVLFADTLKNNILMGMDDQDKVTDDQINTCLEQAQALQFTEKFENKLDHFVGSLGGQLSGGQKQRIAIARALIRKPKLFLFDEATSALDRKNEKEIQNTIDNISNEFTSITVAHRLSTIQNSDNIIVLNHGQIIEQGNHQELMQKEDGFYKNLVEGQIIDKEEQIEDQNLKIEETQEQQIQSHRSINSLQLSSVRQIKDIKDSTSSIYKYLRNEKYLVPPGLLVAIMNGSIMPIFGFLLGRVLGVLQQLNLFVLPGFDTSYFDFTKEDLIWDSDKYVIGFAALAVISMFTNFFQSWIFSVIGQTFTSRLRTIYFRRLLYKDMEYFDREGNEPGKLSERLQSDCNTINVLVSVYFGVICQSISSFIIGLIIAMFSSWRLSLVTLALSPLLIFSGIVESALWAGKSGDKKSGTSQLSETLNNIKIVKSLNAEKDIYQKFKKAQDIIRKKNIKQGFLSSALLSVSQMTQFIVYAVVFWVGAVFVKDYGLTFSNLMVAIFSLLFGAYGAGMANQFLGDTGKAKASAILVTKEIEEQSKIEYDPENPQNNPQGKQRVDSDINGQIEFKNVYFKYKSSKNWILKNINLTIENGQSYALVGGSGSGKSTIFQLIQRFYDVQKGQILLNGQDINLINLKHLREKLGVVRQEPYLFNGTIKYNIKYNKESIINDEKMIEAAQQSNSYDFINTYDNKFDRDVGNRGDQLSGGQKQRINIARCLARNPVIFLFDEATSALDSISEEQVQEAIEKVSQNTTSISIAHRISTIANSDKIYVFEEGKIIEQGNYQELINAKGVFYELANN